jgi:hypothetical protein
MFLQVQKFIQDTGRFTINWLLYDNVFWCLYCLPFATDIEIYFYCSFFLFFSVCLQQYATMDNSYLIPYYNTQSELKVLTFGEIMYYQSNNLTTRARSMSQFSFFLYSGLFDWLPLMVLHCCILLYCYIFCFMSSCENFREIM